jgi:hypothetical protein
MIAAIAPPADIPATYTRSSANVIFVDDLARDARDYGRLALPALLI